MAFENYNKLVVMTNRIYREVVANATRKDTVVALRIARMQALERVFKG